MTQVMNMNIERLTQIIAAYGAAPAHWPDGERAGAQALLARIQAMGVPAERQALQAALTEAEELDGALARFTAPVPDAAMARLTAAVAFPPARMKKTEAHFDLFGILHMIFKPAAAMGATMAALGLFVGFAVDPAYSSGDGSDYTVAQSADAAFSALGQDDGETTP
jgi:hypothetical protein